MEDLSEQITAKEKLIQTLQDQIQTIKDSLELKNEQIKMLEDQIKAKNTKLETLEKTLELKEEEIKSKNDNKVEVEQLTAREKEIEELENNIAILKEELTKVDQDLEMLERENQKLRENSSTSLSSKIIDYTNFAISREEIIESMRNMLNDSVHNIMIAVPSIIDLQDLYLYEIRASISIQISCFIDLGIEEHAELLDEFESLDNISIRLYDKKDRYVLNRDGEELLFAIIGKNEENHLIVHTRDPNHIKLFNSLVMEPWLRARKL